MINWGKNHLVFKDMIKIYTLKLRPKEEIFRKKPSKGCNHDSKGFRVKLLLLNIWAKDLRVKSKWEYNSNRLDCGDRPILT